MDLDFEISADLTFQSAEVSDFVFGIDVAYVLEDGGWFGAGFQGNSSNSMGIVAYSPIEPFYDYEVGPTIGSDTFSFEIDYSASEGWFDYTVLVGGEVIGSATRSITGNLSADVSDDWDLVDGSVLDVQIIAESFSAPVPEEENSSRQDKPSGENH